MKLQIGLIAHSTGWGQLCTQEGIPCVVLDLLDHAVPDECSLLVINKMMTQRERHFVGEYLRAGGAILGYTAHLRGLADVDGVEQEIAYVVSDHDETFPSIHLLDVGIHSLVPHGANALRTDTGTFALRVGPLGGGFAVVLPFDVEALIRDTRSANKSFYFTPDRLPSERVSLVSKGELRHLVHGAFEYLHHARGIPYPHSWYFPNDARNVFTFRIDTDGASREDVDELYRVGRENHVPMSWFLDVKSHERWLDHFRYFAEQEIGLHCYEHQTFAAYEANLRNITRGLQEIRRAGLQPAGFAAPFGIWNPKSARAVDECRFEYSSEFSLAYDTLPLFPQTRETLSRTMQVPIHPVCIGSMLKIGYSEARMRDYFSLVARQKLSRSEPLFFYHHPSHRCWDVVESIFSLAEQGIEKMTMGDYARWWKRRIRTRFTIDLEQDRIRITPGSAVPDDVWLRVVNPNKNEMIVPIQGAIDLKPGAEWKLGETPALPPEDIRRAREFDPRRVVAELYDKMVRRFR